MAKKNAISQGHSLAMKLVAMPIFLEKTQTQEPFISRTMPPPVAAHRQPPFSAPLLMMLSLVPPHIDLTACGFMTDYHL